MTFIFFTPFEAMCVQEVFVITKNSTASTPLLFSLTTLLLEVTLFPKLALGGENTVCYSISFKLKAETF